LATALARLGAFGFESRRLAIGRDGGGSADPVQSTRYLSLNGAWGMHWMKNGEQGRPPASEHTSWQQLELPGHLEYPIFPVGAEPTDLQVYLHPLTTLPRACNRFPQHDVQSLVLLKGSPFDPLTNPRFHFYRVPVSSERTKPPGLVSANSPRSVAFLQTLQKVSRFCKLSKECHIYANSPNSVTFLNRTGRDCVLWVWLWLWLWVRIWVWLLAEWACSHKTCRYAYPLYTNIDYPFRTRAPFDNILDPEANPAVCALSILVEIFVGGRSVL
jgi:hypothetical protein